MVLRTLNDIFFEVIENNSPSLMLHRRGDQWVGISAAEFGRSVLGIARALRNAGVSQGQRVVILSENRPEWTAVDFACLLLGVVVVPLNPNLTDAQTAFVLKDCGARVAFVSSRKQWEKIFQLPGGTELERLFAMDAAPGAPASPMPPPCSGNHDAEIEAAARHVQPSDLATIIYTSGTTGEPKGVMLTHGNMAANVNHSLMGFDIYPGDVCLSFLPLSHVTARHVDLAMLHRGATLAYVSVPERLPDALRQVRPTLFVGVPRVYEKLYTQIQIKTQHGLAHVMYRWAMRVGRNHRREILTGQQPASLMWKLADRLLYCRIRQALGGRARIHISGGAPFGRPLAEWYADVGIRIYEGYGLTETAPVISVNKPQAHRIGTVGKPLENIEIRIAHDGEILARGASIFQGYWNHPEETERAFADGWFKTGDIGNLDEDGFLSVTDRKKDLIKTSGGKYIAPQPIEARLKHNAMIAEAVVFGDRRKFPSVLIQPYFPQLEEWARARPIPFASRRQLIEQAEVMALYEGIVADANRDLASFEQLKQVLLMVDEFTIESGMLTATMKVRRRQVQEHIEQLLREGAIVAAHHRRD